MKVLEKVKNAALVELGTALLVGDIAVEEEHFWVGEMTFEEERRVRLEALHPLAYLGKRGNRARFLSGKFLSETGTFEEE